MGTYPTPEPTLAFSLYLFIPKLACISQWTTFLQVGFQVSPRVLLWRFVIAKDQQWIPIQRIIMLWVSEAFHPYEKIRQGRSTCTTDFSKNLFLDSILLNAFKNTFCIK